MCFYELARDNSVHVRGITLHMAFLLKLQHQTEAHVKTTLGGLLDLKLSVYNALKYCLQG